MLVTGVNEMMTQFCDDLVAFASHAHRRTVDKSDVECVMRRQRFVSAKTSLDDLIREHLPREYVDELISAAQAKI